MSKSKIIFWLIFLIVLSGVGYFYGPKAHKFLTRTRCSEVKTYSINSIDARFNMTQDEFKKYIDTAAENWNRAYGVTLFSYDPLAKLDFNLVFDERQGLSSEINNLEGDLDSKKDNIEPQIAEYERLVSVYKKKADDLNKEILFYNDQGGAPEEKFSEIIERQKELQNDAAALNALAAQLNQSTDEYNFEVGKLNSTVKTFNNTLEYKPEQGIYASGDERIEIYFATDKEELIHTLMHEMGHSLGLDHTEEERDIMFSYTSRETTPSETDLSNLRLICAENVILERYRTNIEYLKELFIKKNTSTSSS